MPFCGGVRPCHGPWLRISGLRVSRAIGNMLGWTCLFRRDRSALSATLELSRIDLVYASPLALAEMLWFRGRSQKHANRLELTSRSARIVPSPGLPSCHRRSVYEDKAMCADLASHRDLVTDGGSSERAGIGARLQTGRRARWRPKGMLDFR